ncbi:MAG: L-seryl-tRNA(Sec) selenium transferase, partial [Anaerolineales bacterium]|nr:L-seryl-tRNA(Sec) selenium transferase [Anaerolineales bacterium]
MTDLRSLPSVDHLLRASSGFNWTANYGHPLTVQAIRQALEEARRVYLQEQILLGEQELLEIASKQLNSLIKPSLQSVINATGVILHTNLGRAPLSQTAIQAMHEVAKGYSNLEYNLHSGRRGTRLLHADQLLKQICAAEATLVVNNNASAVLLILTALARRRRVLI